MKSPNADGVSVFPFGIHFTLIQFLLKPCSSNPNVFGNNHWPVLQRAIRKLPIRRSAREKIPEEYGGERRPESRKWSAICQINFRGGKSVSRNNFGTKTPGFCQQNDF